VRPTYANTSQLKTEERETKVGVLPRNLPRRRIYLLQSLPCSPDNMSRYWQQLESMRKKTLLERVALNLPDDGGDDVVLLYRPRWTLKEEKLLHFI